MFTLVYPDLTQKETTLTEVLKKDSYTLLYFYPKDDTPGCTIEAQEFTKYISSFQQLDIQVVWVSKDLPERHCAFIKKYTLQPLYVSDPTLELHKQFGAWWTKKMYGKELQGTIRSTILLENKGAVIHHRKSVKAKGHAEKVLERCREKFKTEG